MSMDELDMRKMIEDFQNAAKLVLSEKPVTSPGPLDALFEYVMHEGKANLTIGDTTHPVDFERYRSRRGGIAGGSLRLIFKNPQHPDKKQVHLEISPEEFEILTLVDMTNDLIPHCDTGDNTVRTDSASIYVVDRTELRQASESGPSPIHVDEYSIRRTGQFVQVPIFRRAVYNPGPVEPATGQSPTSSLPDFPLTSVKKFSEQALLEIISEIDPGMDHGYSRQEWYKPIELRPALKPTQDLVGIIIQNLSV